jgi:hypothetical protein
MEKIEPKRINHQKKKKKEKEKKHRGKMAEGIGIHGVARL